MRCHSAVRNTATRLSISIVVVLCVFAGMAMAQSPVVKPNIHSLSAPLAFQPNLGQLDTATRFAVYGLGYSLELQPDGTKIVLTGGTHEEKKSARLLMKIDGARSAAEGRGLDKMASYSNSFVGSDRSKWLTGIPHYGKVRFDHVYDGIDVLYYGTNGKLEYDFIVAPGADPSLVRLSIDGARSISLVDGSVQLATEAGTIELLKPTVYQDVRGQRRVIESSYTVNGNHVGFNIAKYDPALPLIIDPTLSYSNVALTFGKDIDSAEGVAINSAGEVFVAGSLSDAGNWDAYVLKYNAAGAFVWNTRLGGNGMDYGLDIALVQSGADAGKVFVTGLTKSTDFPTVAVAPATDGFLVKLTTAGAIESSKRIGNTITDEQVESVAVVPNGSSYDVFIGGATKSLLGGLLSGSLLAGQWNGFVAKADTTGTILQGILVGPVDVFATNAFPARSAKVAAGSNANEVFFAGSSSAAFLCPIGATCTPGATPSGSNAVAVKLNTLSGLSISTITWIAPQTPATQANKGTSIASMGGAAYLTGYTTGSIVCSGCTAGAYGAVIGNGDAFVVKIDSNGTPSRYTYLGGGQSDTAFDIAVQNPHLVVTGQTFIPGMGQPEFPTLNAAKFLREGQESYITEFDSNLALVSSSFVGSAVADRGKAVAANTSSIAVVGWNSDGEVQNGFVSVLNESGLSILSMTVNNCYDAPCSVSISDVNSVIGTVTVTLSGPLGTNNLQVIDGNTHITIGSRSPNTTTGSVYTFPIVLVTVPGAGETVGAIIDAKLNGIVGATKEILVRGPEPLGGLVFSSNPAPANSPLFVTVQFGAQSAPNMKVRITKSNLDTDIPASTGPASYLKFPTGSTTNADGSISYQLPIPNSSTTSVMFKVNTLNPPADQTVRLRADLIDANNNTTGVFLVSTPDLVIKPHVFKLPSVNGITLSTSAVKGGTNLTATLALDCPAGVTPAVPQLIELESLTPGVTVPASVTVATGVCTSPAFTITTTPVAANVTATIRATLNGSMADGVFALNAPKVIAPLTLNPATVNGGQASTGTITLDGPTPLGGVVVDLSSNNDAVVTYPATVVVNDTTAPYQATFTINNSSPAAGATVVFTAAANGGTSTATLTIRPTATFPVGTVNLPAATVTGGSTLTGTVTLSCAPGQTPTSPITVNLSSNNAGVTISPTSLTIPAGTCTSPAFTVITSAVATATPVVITATSGSSTATANFTVNAPKVTGLSLNPIIVNGGQTATGTITLDGPTPVGGITVNISSNNNAAVTYPATVVVNDTTAPYQGTFPIQAGNPAATTAVIFTATLNGTSTATLTVRGAGGGIIPYSNFTVQVVVDLNKRDDDDNFFVDGDFTLGTATDGINPALEDVTLKVGQYSVVIPKGSFNRQGDRDEDGDDDRRKPREVWHFNGKIGNDRLHIHIHGYGSNQYNIRARGHRVDMTGVVNGTPIEVTLQVGNDGGSAVDASPRVHPRVFDIKDLVLTPRSVVGGTSSTGTVSLKCSYGATPTVPVTITLTAEAGSGVSVPATVTIPAGPSCSASFPITTTAVTRTNSVTIKATFGDANDDWEDWFNWRGWWNNWQGWWRHTSESANLTVYPVTIKDLDLSARTVNGGTSLTGKVTLNCDDNLVLTSAVTVALSAEAGTGVSVPASVVVPAGSCSASFPITTSDVSKTVSATIRAAIGYSDETATLTVKK